MEQVAAEANPPVAQNQRNGGAPDGAGYALTDDLLAGRFFSIDVRGQVTGWNPRAEAAFGWSTHHVSGVSLFEKLLVSGLGFGPADLEEFFAAASGGAGRRVRVLINHEAGSQLPVELSIVPIQLAKAYELNAFLQDVSTSTASGVASEIGRVREEHSSVLAMIASSLDQEPGSAPDGEVRLAGALVVFHIDAGAATPPPPPGSDGSGAVAPAPAAEDPSVARAEAERVRAQIDEALAAAEEAREETAVARAQRDELQAQLDAAAASAGGEAQAAQRAVEEARREAETLRARADEVESAAAASREAADEARRDAERLRGELDGLRAAADGSQASAEANAADLGQTRAELSQARSEVEQLGEQLGRAEADVAAAREERDALRTEIHELRNQVESAGAAQAELAEARSQVESLESELAAARTEVDAAAQRAEEIAADAAAAREGGAEAEAAVASARDEAHAAQAEATEARARVEALEGELETAREELVAARSEIESSGGRTVLLEEELASARSETESARSEAAESEERIVRLTERASEEEQAAAAAREQAEAASAEADAARAEAATVREEATAARTEAAEATARADAATAELDAARTELAAATERADAAEADMAAARTELKTAQEETAAIRADLDAAHAQAESAGKTVGDAQAELGEARSDAVKARADAEKAAADAEEARTAAEQATAEAEEARAAAEKATADAEEARAATEAAHDAPADPTTDPVFEAIFDGAAIGMAIKQDGRFVRVNRALSELTGRDAADLLKIDPVKLVHPDERDAHAATVQSLLSGEAASSNSEARLLHATGDEVTVRESASILEDGKVLVQFELTEADAHTAVEDRDPVTGLFSRRRFEEELSRHIAQAAKNGDRGAALMLDLEANTSGLDAAQGEELLKTVAEALKENIDGPEMLAHLGGDEFGLLLPKADADQARKIADKLVESVGSQVVEIGKHSVEVTIKVAVALFDERQQPPAAAAPAPEAPAAPAEAPAEPAEPADNLPAPVAQTGAGTALAPADGIVDRIRKALADDSFSLYAQPIIDLRTSEITQYELLLRMHDDASRLMLPDKFLPAAHQAGLMPAIDQWVVRHAIGLIHEAAQDGNRLVLEVNISADSIDDPALTALIEAELDATGVDPRLLVIEVTENAALAKIQETIKLSKWLRSMGCRFALDDFGSTFATVKYLKDMAVDYFKLDGDLIVTLPESRTNQLLLNALMDVARGTGTQTIAVYVPDDETLVMLRQYGIGYGQGNRVGRPRPVAEI